MAKYNVTYALNNGEGKVEFIKGSVEFSKCENTYGNGFYMYIESSAEPFGGQSYDIRYDSDFNKNHMIEYIVSFLSRRYTGENGSWKLVGVNVFDDNGLRED